MMEKGQLMSRNYWWANQALCWKEDRAQGYIAGPLCGRNGKKFQHYSNLGKLNPGDVILHAPSTGLESISQVTDLPQKVVMPAHVAKIYRSSGQEEGWVCKVEYFDLINGGVGAWSVPSNWKNNIPKWLRESGGTGIYRKDGQVKAGLLWPITEYFVDELKKLFPDVWPPGCPLVESD